MRLSDLVRTGSQLVQVELLIAEMQFKLQSKRFLLGLIAAGAIAIGFVMLNVAGYRWLAFQLGPVGAPLSLAAADMGIAILALLIAGSMRAGPELTEAEYLKKSLISDIERSMNPSPSGAGFGIDARTLQILLPALVSVIRALRRRNRSTSQNTMGRS
jgi:hypothetical protein